MANARTLKVKLQLFCGDEIAMGPGKADLLDAIEAAGLYTSPMAFEQKWPATQSSLAA